MISAANHDRIFYIISAVSTSDGNPDVRDCVDSQKKQYSLLTPVLLEVHQFFSEVTLSSFPVLKVLERQQIDPVQNKKTFISEPP